MKRKALADLKNWLTASKRKPLILRGARQVGKSTLVRLFCKQENLELIEFNLEIEKLVSIHSDNENFKLQELLDEIQLKKQQKLSDNSLIFFDEIQESPRLLKLLRYFYEQSPRTKVIAAGSRLEIALNDAEFYHLGPMSFQEFLWATNDHILDEALKAFKFNPSVHQAGLAALRNFYYTGGMPEAVKSFSETKSILEVRRIQSQILQTYQADFPKYNKRINLQRIARIFSNMALNVGKKIIYSKLDHDTSSRDIRRIVELLIDAKVILPCIHSDANHIPLLGESDPTIFKTYFLDIGLLNSILKLDLETIDLEFKNNFSTRGALAEQYVAQHLNFLVSRDEAPQLIYHLKDKGTQKAEIDFLIETNQNLAPIIPIEVKSTTSGHLKSLKYFCTKKNATLGIKCSLAEFSREKNFTENADLINIPLYAIEYLKANLSSLII